MTPDRESQANSAEDPLRFSQSPAFTPNHDEAFAAIDCYGRGDSVNEPGPFPISQSSIPPLSRVWGRQLPNYSYRNFRLTLESEAIFSSHPLNYGPMSDAHFEADGVDKSSESERLPSPRVRRTRRHSRTVRDVSVSSIEVANAADAYLVNFTATEDIPDFWQVSDDEDTRGGRCGLAAGPTVNRASAAGSSFQRRGGVGILDQSSPQGPAAGESTQATSLPSLVRTSAKSAWRRSKNGLLSAPTAPDSMKCQVEASQLSATSHSIPPTPQEPDVIMRQTPTALVVPAERGGWGSLRAKSRSDCGISSASAAAASATGTSTTCALEHGVSAAPAEVYPPLEPWLDFASDNELGYSFTSGGPMLLYPTYSAAAAATAAAAGRVSAASGTMPGFQPVSSTSMEPSFPHYSMHWRQHFGGQPFSDGSDTAPGIAAPCSESGGVSSPAQRPRQSRQSFNSTASSVARGGVGGRVYGGVVASKGICSFFETDPQIPVGDLQWSESTKSIATFSEAGATRVVSSSCPSNGPKPGKGPGSTAGVCYLPAVYGNMPAHRIAGIDTGSEHEGAKPRYLRSAYQRLLSCPGAGGPFGSFNSGCAETDENLQPPQPDISKNIRTVHHTSHDGPGRPPVPIAATKTTSYRSAPSPLSLANSSTITPSNRQFVKAAEAPTSSARSSGSEHFLVSTSGYRGEGVGRPTKSVRAGSARRNGSRNDSCSGGPTITVAGSSGGGDRGAIRVGKVLAYLLRHGALLKRIPIRSDAFVKVKDILDQPQCRQWLSLSSVLDVVEHNNKRRYDLGLPALLIARLREHQQSVETAIHEFELVDCPPTPPANTPLIPMGEHDENDRQGLPSERRQADKGANIGRKKLPKVVEGAIGEITAVTISELLQFLPSDVDRKQRAMDRILPLLYIRACQGHSIKGLDPNKIYHKVRDAEEVPLCLHGTYWKLWSSILSTGLKRMARQYVHFARGFSGDPGVISGIRGNAEIVVEVDVKRAMEDGMEFWIAANGVVLSCGFDGVVPPRYFTQALSLPDRIAVPLVPTTARSLLPLASEKSPEALSGLAARSPGETVAGHEGEGTVTEDNTPAPTERSSIRGARAESYENAGVDFQGESANNSSSSSAGSTVLYRTQRVCPQPVNKQQRLCRSEHTKVRTEIGNPLLDE